MDSNGLSYPIHLGFWTNWSHGRVFGSTLTLSKSDGALLIAFLAFFVTLVGTRVWRIICFALFHFFSKPTSQDTLHNQRQAILRNSASPIGGTWVFIRMVHAWSGSRATAQPLKRLLPLLIGCFLFAIALTVASGLSSQIVRGNEVLIDGSRCGLISSKKVSSNLDTLFSEYKGRRMVQAAEYAQRCYESKLTSEDCNVFVRAALPMTATSNASCPFDESICLSQDSNLILDSGLMDSLDDFGLNWAPKSRFKLRYKTHCAPLVTEGYSSRYPFGNTTYLRYQYGPTFRTGNSIFDCNCTSAINTDVTELWSQGNSSSPPGSVHHYSTSNVFASFTNGSANKEWSVFDPIPELTGHKGDLSITFLFPNEVMFREKSQDIWYRATTASARTMIGPDGGGGIVEMPLYFADEPAWPMGCVEQYQACKGDKCTELGSLDDTASAISSLLNMISDFHGTASYFSLMTSLPSLILSLGKESLAMRHRGVIVIQPGPKKNEWHLDVTHWFAAVLSSLQIYTAELASGKAATENPELKDAMIVPVESERQDFCYSQKIRSTAYTSFSTFWLFFIIGVGTLLVFISVGLEPLTNFVNKRLAPRWNGYAHLEWRANHTLHLHHLAHEGKSLPKWGLSLWDVPVTDPECHLEVFDITQTEGPPHLLHHEDCARSKTNDSNDIIDGKATMEEKPHAIHSEDGMITPASPVSSNTTNYADENSHSHWQPVGSNSSTQSLTISVEHRNREEACENDRNMV